MLEQGGARIVFITSISSYTASVNRAEYCLSKAALSMSVALYAERLAASGIQVFEIRPGIIRTDMIAAVEKSYEERIAGGLVPQRRLGEGADVAKAVRAIADAYGMPVAIRSQVLLILATIALAWLLPSEARLHALEKQNAPRVA